MIPPIVLLDRKQVMAAWGQIVQAIAPALRREQRSSWPVLDALIRGDFECWRIGDQGYVVSSVGYVEQTEIKACWLVFAAGEVPGGPKARVRLCQEILRWFEALARKAGCREMRFETRRAWRHVLADYEEIGVGPMYTIYRKAL